MPTETIDAGRAKARDAIAFLRAAGREEEASAVAALLPRSKGRRLQPQPPAGQDQKLVPIAEAAARLGLSRNAGQRRIDLGLIDGVRQERNGYRFVTEASVRKLDEAQRTIATVAAIPGDSDDALHPDSLLSQMLRDADRVDPLDDEEKPE